MNIFYNFFFIPLLQIKKNYFSKGQGLKWFCGKRLKRSKSWKFCNNVVKSFYMLLELFEHFFTPLTPSFCFIKHLFSNFFTLSLIFFTFIFSKQHKSIWFAFFFYFQINLFRLKNQFHLAMIYRVYRNHTVLNIWVNQCHWK